MEQTYKKELPKLIPGFDELINFILCTNFHRPDQVILNIFKRMNY